MKVKTEDRYPKLLEMDKDFGLYSQYRALLQEMRRADFNAVRRNGRDLAGIIMDVRDSIKKLEACPISQRILMLAKMTTYDGEEAVQTLAISMLLQAADEATATVSVLYPKDEDFENYRKIAAALYGVVVNGENTERVREQAYDALCEVVRRRIVSVNVGIGVHGYRGEW